MIAFLTRIAKRKGAAIFSFCPSASIIPVNGRSRKRHAGSKGGIERYGQRIKKKKFFFFFLTDCIL